LLQACLPIVHYTTHLRSERISTLYSLCQSGVHTLKEIGPSLENWLTTRSVSISGQSLPALSTRTSSVTWPRSSHGHSKASGIKRSEEHTSELKSRENIIW